MLLPPEYAWFEPVLLAASIVFIIDVIGSTLVFSSRPVLNALASAIVFAIILGFLVYYGYGKVEMSVVNDATTECSCAVPSCCVTANRPMIMAPAASRNDAFLA